MNIKRVLAATLLPILGLSIPALVGLCVFAAAGILGAGLSGKPSVVMLAVGMWIYVGFAAVGVWAGWEFVKTNLFSLPRVNRRISVRIGMAIGALCGIVLLVFAHEHVTTSSVAWTGLLFGYACYVLALLSEVSPNNSLQARRP